MMAWNWKILPMKTLTGRWLFRTDAFSCCHVTSFLQESANHVAYIWYHKLFGGGMKSDWSRAVIRSINMHIVFEFIIIQNGNMVIRAWYLYFRVFIATIRTLPCNRYFKVSLVLSLHCLSAFRFASCSVRHSQSVPLRLGWTRSIFSFPIH